MRILPLLTAFALSTMTALPVAAQTIPARAVDDHILPRFATLAADSAALADAARADCTPTAEPLRTAYHAAFDAWIAASHLRFGPTEEDSRAYALAFWPDPRGRTQKALAGLITAADPVVDDPEGFAEVSVAARGFYALERLLFDETVQGMGKAAYLCRLTVAVTGDLARVSAVILADWQDGYAEQMRSAGAPGNAIYPTEKDALTQLYKALQSGLQVTEEFRLGKPLGTFDRPRPRLAEAWRSGRSLRNVRIALASTRDLALILASGHRDVAESVGDAFDRAEARAEALDDPIFAGVSDPVTRFPVEVLMQSVTTTRSAIAAGIGPALGVAEGFNALDGD